MDEFSDQVAWIIAQCAFFIAGLFLENLHRLKKHVARAISGTNRLRAEEPHG